MLKQSIRTRLLPMILVVSLVIGAAANLVNVHAPATGILVACVSALLWLTIWLLRPVITALSSRQVKTIVAITILLMVLVQLMVLHWLPVTVYHDPYRVLAQADQMAAGHYSWRITYFWRYPNNVPLVWLLSGWLRLSWMVGLTTNAAIHLLCLLLLDGLVIMTTSTLLRLHVRSTVVLGVLAFCAATPFAYTYFLQVFYSDLPALVLWVAILRRLLFWPQSGGAHRWWACAELLVYVIAGQVIRPNMIVIVPALVITLMVVGVRRWRQARLVVPTLVIAIAITLSFPVTSGIQRLSHFHNRDAYALPTSSWIMMGLNPNTRGQYSGHDVGVEVQLPSKTARQRYSQRVIKRRIRQLGPVGLTRQIITKLGVLLNVESVQDWYNGGYRAAPGWYQHHAATIRTVIAVVYQAAVINLFLAVILRLLAWRPRRGDRYVTVTLLAIVIVLGYLAFHALLWETESRYGQVILPLLWLILGLLPAASARTTRTSRWAWPIAAGVGLLTLLLGGRFMAQRYPQNLVIAAQRSQLSTQYRARPATVAPGARITEDVDIKGTANYLSVQAHLHARVRVTLTNLRTGQRYHLYDAGVVYRLHHQLRPGRYRIRVDNNQAAAQRVDFIQTHRYRLAPHPLVLNGRVYRYSSLIYTVLHKKTVDQTGK